jgi:hypothetical protein
MGLVSGCRAVLHRLGTVDQKVAWLSKAKLTKRELLKYALSDDVVLRQKSWEVLNQHPSLIMDIAGRDENGSRCFSSDVERLFRRPDALPLTIAKVFAGLMFDPFKKEDIDRAVRILKFHQVREQGEIMSELGLLNRELFGAIRRFL